MTPELLKTYYDSFSKPINLKDLRSICMFIVGFAGFYALNLKSHDILFHDTHVSLFIQKSKTDIYRDGSWVILSKTSSNLCPVKILHNYLSLGKIKNDSDKYIFRNLQKNKSGFTLRKENKPMTYIRFREMFIESFKSLVPNIKMFGLHSLRSGGASMPMLVFQIDFLSATVDGEVKMLKNSRLRVSHSLGL